MSCFIYYYAECHYAACRYAECRYVECLFAECRYTECHSADEMKRFSCVKQTLCRPMSVGQIVCRPKGVESFSASLITNAMKCEKMLKLSGWLKLKKLKVDNVNERYLAERER